MANQVNQSDINRAAWEACNIFRGAMDPFVYKDYVLATLFWKYISDVWQAKREENLKRYRNDQARQRQKPKSVRALSCQPGRLLRMCLINVVKPI